MWTKDSTLKKVIRIFLCMLIGGKSLFVVAQPIIQTSFEDLPDSSLFTQASWQQEGFTVPWVDGFDQKRAYVDTHYAHVGKKSLRVFYPKGGFGPDQTGAQAPLQVPSASQYYISYWLRFDEQFSWGTTSEGGKLPGLGSGQNCSGCTTCTGSNGFSARLMWRTGGKAVLYLYDMDKKATCGDDYALLNASGSDFYFQKGQWHHVVERVKVNTGANHDGEVEVWMDGQHSLLLTGLEFVSNGDQVDNLYFSTFHGGSTVDWAPTVDCYTWFDDIVISTHATDVLPLPLAVDPTVQQEVFTISPQPMSAGNFVTIQSTQKVSLKSVELLDMSGKSIVSREVHESMKFLVPQVKKEIYFLKFHFVEGTSLQKVYIE